MKRRARIVRNIVRAGHQRKSLDLLFRLVEVGSSGAYTISEDQAREIFGLR